MFKRISFASALLAGTALMAGAASAADLVEEPAPLFNWSGFYIGVHAGAVFGQDLNNGCGAFKDLVGDGGVPLDVDAECDNTLISDGSGSPHHGEFADFFDLDDDFVAVFGHDSDNGTDFLAGGQIGVQQQYGNWVIGLEADASGVFGGDDRNIEFEYFHTQTSDLDQDLENFQGVGHVTGGDLDWLATFRARLGFAAGSEGRLLFYGTGGVALAGINGLKGTFDDTNSDHDWCDACVFGDSDDSIRVGWTVGAGLEWAFADNWSLGAEYLFVGFGDWDEGPSLTFYADDGRQFTFEDDLDHLHVVRAKLNWRF
jgi:outer membrane immunogenic protein